MAAKEESHIDLSRCKYGHSNPALKAFLHRNRHFMVPIRNWGGKTFTHV